MVVFTFELVVQRLEGEALRAWNRSGRSGPPWPTLPTLAFRLMDLAPVLLEAAIVDGCVEFHGKGKALVFDLPEELQLTQLPLWILLLLPEPSTQSTGDRCATLLASTCLDLRHEVIEAIRREADMSLQAVPFFRRCSFGMTSIAEEKSLQLTCFLRLYCGRHQPLTGGELLLEPIAWPRHQEGAVENTMAANTAARVVNTVETQTEDSKIEPQLPARTSAPGPPRVGLAPQGDPVDRLLAGASAIFPQEIELTGTEAVDVYPSSPTEELEDPVDPVDAVDPVDPVDPVPPSAVPPAVPPVPPAEPRAVASSALPLVSQLVKELMQISSPA